MAIKHEKVDREEARRQVLSIIKRMALLHYSFAKTLVEKLGEKRGKEVARQAADFYVKFVGKKVLGNTQAKGTKPLAENYQEDLPSLGWDIKGVVVEGEPRPGSQLQFGPSLEGARRAGFGPYLLLHGSGKIYGL